MNRTRTCVAALLSAGLVLGCLGGGCDKKDERKASDDLKARGPKMIEDMDKYAEPAPVTPAKAPEEPKPTTVAPPALPATPPAPTDPTAPKKKEPEKP